MSTQNQNTDTTPDTTGAELAVQQAAMIDPFEAFRVSIGKAIAPSMKTVVEKSMGGWDSLHGKSAADRVVDATTRMIGGNVASGMIAETRISIAAKLFAQATAEESVIGKAGTYKSDSEWLSRVNAALLIGEDGKRDAYNLQTLRNYAKLYRASERWTKEFKLEFGKDDGMYRSLGTTVCNRLAELEKSGGLDKAEFGRLIELCRNGGTVKVGNTEENVPAAAPRSSKSVDACYAALADSLGKAIVLPAEKIAKTRAASGATNQQTGELAKENDLPSGNTSGETIDKNVSAYDAFCKLAAIAESTLSATVVAMAKMAATYASAKMLNDAETVVLLEQAFTKTCVNPYAANIWSALKREAIDAAKVTKAKQDSAAISAILDANTAGSDIPERITWDGVEVTVTDEHRKLAALEIAKKQPKK